MRKVLYILGQLTDGDAEWMARIGTKKILPPGTVLIRQNGARLDKLYILLDGHLNVEVENVGRIAALGSGEVVGEMSFVDTARPSATVITEEGCTILEIARSALDHKISTDHGFGMRFYHALSIFLADRLRGTVHRMGYGEGTSLGDENVLEGELDEAILDTLSLAGERFDRMLKMLASAPAG